MKTLIFAITMLFGHLAFAETNRACFYEDINYKGSHFCVNVGARLADLSRSGWNRRISSIAIYGEAEVTLYSAFNFGGNSTRTVVSRPNLRAAHFNDVPASIRVTVPNPQACLFKDINYGGTVYCIGSGREIKNLKSIGWNDAVSSVKLIGDASAYLYENIEFGGRMVWIRNSVPNIKAFGAAWNDRASSVIVAPKAGRRLPAVPLNLIGNEEVSSLNDFSLLETN